MIKEKKYPISLRGMKDIFFFRGKLNNIQEILLFVFTKAFTNHDRIFVQVLKFISGFDGSYSGL